MKKQNLIALVGVVAIMANLLLPSLAFGQVGSQQQQGTAEITCDSAASPSFYMLTQENGPLVTTDIANFNFYVDGTQEAIVQSGVTQQVYSDQDDVVGIEMIPNRFLEIFDPRDPRASVGPAPCNTGIKVDVRAVPVSGKTHTFADESDLHYITMDGSTNLYIATTNGYNSDNALCPEGFNPGLDNSMCWSVQDGVHGRGGAWCNTPGAGDECTDTGLFATSQQILGTDNDFATADAIKNVNSSVGYLATDTGTPTEHPVDILNGDTGWLGYAGTNSVFSLDIPAYQTAGKYTTTIVYTLFDTYTP